MTTDPPAKDYTGKDYTGKDYADRRFLIVDDKAFIRSVVRGMLERLAAPAVIEAANGAQARALIEADSSIDCVICDWNMAPVSGLELLQAVRTGAIAATPRSLCFILLTGHAAEETVKAAIGLDVNAYLVKPVSFEKLIRTVDQALTQRIVLKPAADYAALAGLEAPEAARAAANKVLPWMTPHPSHQAQFRERIGQIRHELQQCVAAPIRNSRREAVARVAPGQVLAEDIFSDFETLLAPAGTVLTPAVLAHLRAFAAEAEDDAHIWIGDAPSGDG